MPLDPYSACPCGSGKKIKFCCKDIAHEIDAVLRMLEGEQYEAARNRVIKALRKDPLRATLLELKAEIELTQGNLEAARKTIDEFLVAHPENSVAWGQRAQLLAQTGDAFAAADALQRALAFVQHGSLHGLTFRAIYGVAISFAKAGDLFASRAHLELYESAAPEEDNQALEMVSRFNRMGIPLPLRDTYLPQELEADGSAGMEEFHRSSQLTRAGRWKVAEEILAGLLDSPNPPPRVVYNLALIRGRIGQREALVRGLREYVAGGVTRGEGLSALLLAAVVEETYRDQIPVVAREYELPDLDTLRERLIDESLCEQRVFNPYYSSQSSKDPEPLFATQLLDRPFEPADCGVGRLPSSLAGIELFGKQTDRPARVVLVFVDDDRRESLLAEFERITGDTVGELRSESEIDRENLFDVTLSVRCPLPPQDAGLDFVDILRGEQRRRLVELWPHLPNPILDGQSLVEALADERDRSLAIDAAWIRLENTLSMQTMEGLREELGVPEVAPIDPADFTGLIPLVCIAYLDFNRLDDDELTPLFARCVFAAANRELASVAERIVERDLGEQAVNLKTVYYHWIAALQDPEQIEALIERARAALGEDEEAGNWDLLALEKYAAIGAEQRIVATLDRLGTRYGDNPDVHSKAYAILAHHGLVDPDVPQPAGGPRRPPHAVGASAASAPSSKIWTPGSETAEPGKKLWTPS